MRECLSKALQWKSPDLLVGKNDAEHIVMRLEELLNFNYEKLNTGYRRLEFDKKLEVILVEIKNKNFEIMEECLNVLKTYVPGVVNELWNLYQQYLSTDFDTIVCLCCKIRSRVDIKHCSRYLYRSGIVSGHLHETIICRNADVGSQEDLWNELEDECDRYHTPRQVVEAINYGLHAQGDQYESLLAGASWLNQENTKFKCKCQETCSDMFVPNTYKLATQSSSNCANILDKENKKPKSDQTDHSGNSRRRSIKTKCRAKRSTPIATSERRKSTAKASEKENRETGAVVAQEAIKYFGQGTSGIELNNDDTGLQQSISQKRKVDNSSKCRIFNFYNKGNVNVGTSVVQMQPTTRSNTPIDDTDSDPNSSPEERCIRPSHESAEESFTKRLKYTNQPLAAITYPTDTETSDESQNVSHPTTIDIQTKNKTKTQDVSGYKQNRFKPETAHRDVSMTGPCHMQKDHDVKTGRGPLLRQCSAPSGYSNFNGSQ